MPLLKHAKKKLRQDKKRAADNLKLKQLYKKLIKDAKTTKTPEAVSKAYQAIDKAAKKFIIHDNKAARLKSSLAKAMNSDSPSQAATTKRSTKTKASKKVAGKKTSKKATKKK